MEAKVILGRSTWDTIHGLAATYDRPSKKQAFINYMYSLTDLYPCDMCRNNLLTHLTTDLPLEDRWFKSNVSLFTWTFMLHNIVNRDTGKPEMRWQDAERKWSVLLKNKSLCKSCEL